MTSVDPVEAEDAEYDAVAFDDDDGVVLLIDAQDMMNREATIRTDTFVEVER